MANIKLSNVKILKSFGFSMKPLLLDGDVVYILKKPFSKIVINDIVCFTRKGRMLTHRGIYKTPKYLITKGDNNIFSDGKVYPKNIKGVVNRVKRKDEVFSIDDLYLIQSTIYFKEIVRLKKTLEKLGIKHVFLKGLPLHLYYEGIHPRRIYADCDLLIDRKDFYKVKKALIQQGLMEIDSSLSKTQTKLKKHITELSFGKVISGVPVIFDVHLEAIFMMSQLGNLNSLYPQKLLSAFSKDLIKNSTSIKVQGETFKTLKGSYLVIYLGLHLFLHNFKGTYRFDFVKKVIDWGRIDYLEMESVIIKYKLTNFIYPFFMLMQKYYHVDLSPDLMRNIRPNKRILSLINNKIIRDNIFDEDDRVDAGVRRFLNRFYLSPRNILQKTLIFLDQQVIYAILWVVSNRIKRTAGNILRR